MHTVSHPTQTIEIVAPAYTPTAAPVGALILGIPGAMFCSLASVTLILASSGGFAGIAWMVGITLWTTYLAGMVALWAYDN